MIPVHKFCGRSREVEIRTGVTQVKTTVVVTVAIAKGKRNGEGALRLFLQGVLGPFHRKVGFYHARNVVLYDTSFRGFFPLLLLAIVKKNG